MIAPSYPMAARNPIRPSDGSIGDITLQDQRMSGAFKSEVNETIEIKKPDKNPF